MSNETPQQPTPANELLEALGTTLSPDLLVPAEMTGKSIIVE